MTKLRLLLFIYISVFCAVLIRLFYVQIIDRKDTGDYLRTRIIRASRGRLFDRNLKPFVTNQTKYRLFVEPDKVTDKDNIFQILAKKLEVEEASLEAKFDESKKWISLHTNINRTIKENIEGLNLQGVGFEEYPSRYYPEGSSSAHLLGFVGKNIQGDDVGYFGLEGYYEKDLVGMSGLMQSERDLYGQPIFLGIQERIPAENGRDIITTIDISIQRIIKKHLLEGLEAYKAKEGCVITADPYTMEILGLVCEPDFDPENYYNYPSEYYKNSTISDVYEPGSTFKPLILASAIEQKAVSPNDMYNEEGPVTIGEYSIKTWNNSYEGKITMTRIMEKSSNVGMVYIGSKIGNKKLYDSIKQLGFGSLTEIDLQGEIANPLKPFSQFYPIDFATLTFGQGIAVTPIQMIKAFASLINGGYLLQPHLVKEIKGSKKNQIVTSRYKKRIFSQYTSDVMKKILVSTIENGETKNLRPKGYAIGGKTGTAQVAISGHYDPSKTIASFIGFAPIHKPRFVMIVLLKEPKTSQWGSETAAPVFFNIAKDLIVYYNIAPE